MDTPETGSYLILPHVSRCCFARVLRVDGAQKERPLSQQGQRTYRCTNCDKVAEGYHVNVLCACGIRLKSGTGPNAGIRCVPNANPTPECQSRYVAEQTGLMK